VIGRHRARSDKACPGGPPVSRLPRRSACRRWRDESSSYGGTEAEELMRLDRSHVSDFLISDAALSERAFLSLSDEEGHSRFLCCIEFFHYQAAFLFGDRHSSTMDRSEERRARPHMRYLSATGRRRRLVPSLTSHPCRARTIRRPWLAGIDQWRLASCPRGCRRAPG
jgi:hypothetical protein